MRPILNIELNKLKERMTIMALGRGAYRVTIELRGKQYSCVSHDTMAVDAAWYGRNQRYKNQLEGYKALYKECKNKNYL